MARPQREALRIGEDLLSIRNEERTIMPPQDSQTRAEGVIDNAGFERLWKMPPPTAVERQRFWK
jgi:hypothetical protein